MQGTYICVWGLEFRLQGLFPGTYVGEILSLCSEKTMEVIVVSQGV